MIGFRAAHAIPGTTGAEEPDAMKRQANHDKHRNECVRDAKRFRCHEMEKIGPDEPEAPEPEFP